METKQETFSITSSVKTEHRCIAVCEVWTYDVWGNEDDGYEVNDRCCVERAAEIPAVLTISNVPMYPGATDRYRSFPDESSFDANILCSYELDENEAFKYLAGLDDGCGDGTTYYYEDDEDRPIGEIIIVGWKSADPE